MTLRRGCIADDFTGATDLANNLVRAGMRAVQTIGVPQGKASAIDDADAIVVALKSRTAPPEIAVAILAEMTAVRYGYRIPEPVRL